MVPWTSILLPSSESSGPSRGGMSSYMSAGHSGSSRGEGEGSGPVSGVSGTGSTGDDELAPFGWTNIPGGYGSVESIPVCKVFFLRDGVEFGGSSHYTLQMVTLVVMPGPVPSVGDYVWVRTVLSAHFISKVAHSIFLSHEEFQSTPPSILEA